MVEVYWVQVIFLELYSFIHVKSESSRISVFINSSRFGLNVKFQSFWEVPILDLNKTTVPLCNASISGIRCPHRGAVFSYTSRHVDYPYTDGDREACNVFFVWEFLRPLIKGNYLLACLFHKLTVQRPSSSWSRTFNRRTLFLLITFVLVYVLYTVMYKHYCFYKLHYFPGVPLYIIPSHVIYDPSLLCDFLSSNQITRMLFTPSLLEAVLNTPDIEIQNKLKSMR